MATKKPVVINNPTFKWAVIINCIICALCLAIMVILTVVASEKNELALRLYGTCDKVFTLTAGAFLGLLGGKAASPDVPASA
jgi:threonine/homoserine/homoserine lactone efflux protein